MAVNHTDLLGHESAGWGRVGWYGKVDDKVVREGEDGWIRSAGLQVSWFGPGVCCFRDPVRNPDGLRCVAAAAFACNAVGLGWANPCPDAQVLSPPLCIRKVQPTWNLIIWLAGWLWLSIR